MFSVDLGLRLRDVCVCVCLHLCAPNTLGAYETCLAFKIVSPEPQINIYLLLQLEVHPLGLNIKDGV